MRSCAGVSRAPHLPPRSRLLFKLGLAQPADGVPFPVPLPRFSASCRSERLRCRRSWPRAPTAGCVRQPPRACRCVTPPSLPHLASRRGRTTTPRHQLSTGSRLGSSRSSNASAQQQRWRQQWPPLVATSSTALLPARLGWSRTALGCTQRRGRDLGHLPQRQPRSPLRRHRSLHRRLHTMQRQAWGPSAAAPAANWTLTWQQQLVAASIWR